MCMFIYQFFYVGVSSQQILRANACFPGNKGEFLNFILGLGVFPFSTLKPKAILKEILKHF